jgi:16S rRNA (cytosine967-C5)-methyltransferase
VIARFLDEHAEWSLLPANGVLKQQDIAVDTGQFLRLLPHRHDCDGFFAAVMSRAR